MSAHSEAFRSFRRDLRRRALEVALALAPERPRRKVKERIKEYTLAHFWELAPDARTGELRVAWSDPRAGVYFAVRADAAFLAFAADRVARIVLGIHRKKKRRRRDGSDGFHVRRVRKSA